MYYFHNYKISKKKYNKTITLNKKDVNINFKYHQNYEYQQAVIVNYLDNDND